MRKERKDLVFYLGKAEQYHGKADAATSPLLKAAFEGGRSGVLGRGRANSIPRLSKMTGTE
jgi:hypothetical protein